MVIIAPLADGKLYEWEIDGAPAPAREAGAKVSNARKCCRSRVDVIAAPIHDVNEIERQNARLRSTIDALGERSSYSAGHSAALGIALCALVGDEFAKARQLITSAILKEVDSLK